MLKSADQAHGVCRISRLRSRSQIPARHSLDAVAMLKARSVTGDCGPNDLAGWPRRRRLDSITDERLCAAIERAGLKAWHVSVGYLYYEVYCATKIWLWPRTPYCDKRSDPIATTIRHLAVSDCGAKRHSDSKKNFFSHKSVRRHRGCARGHCLSPRPSGFSVPTWRRRRWQPKLEEN